MSNKRCKIVSTIDCSEFSKSWLCKVSVVKEKFELGLIRAEWICSRTNSQFDNRAYLIICFSCFASLWSSLQISIPLWLFAYLPFPLMFISFNFVCFTFLYLWHQICLVSVAKYEQSMYGQDRAASCRMGKKTFLFLKIKYRACTKYLSSFEKR